MRPPNSVRKHGDTALAAAAVLLVAAPLAMLLAQAPTSTPGQKGGGGGLYQRQPPTPTGPAPKFADGTPDLSGVWNGSGSNDSDISRGLKAGEAVVMLPWAEALVKTRKSKDDPEANCLPTGVPRGLSVSLENRADTGASSSSCLRATSTATGRSSWTGASIPRIPIPPGTATPSGAGTARRWWWTRSDSTTSSGSIIEGHPHTEKLHTIERYTRTDLGNMAIEVTIDDPGAYAKPFTTVGRARIMAGTELLEYICQEENTDVEHLSGPALGPGGGGR